MTYDPVRLVRSDANPLRPREPDGAMTYDPVRLVRLCAAAMMLILLLAAGCTGGDEETEDAGNGVEDAGGDEETEDAGNGVEDDGDIEGASVVESTTPTCQVGMTLQSGESCKLPSGEFSVRDDDGYGCLIGGGNICAGKQLRINNLSASKDSDGVWTIESLP